MLVSIGTRIKRMITAFLKNEESKLHNLFSFIRNTLSHINQEDIPLNFEVLLKTPLSKDKSLKIIVDIFNDIVTKELKKPILKFDLKRSFEENLKKLETEVYEFQGNDPKAILDYLNRMNAALMAYYREAKKLVEAKA